MGRDPAGQVGAAAVPPVGQIEQCLDVSAADAPGIGTGLEQSQACQPLAERRVELGQA